MDRGDLDTDADADDPPVAREAPERGASAFDIVLLVCASLVLGVVLVIAAVTLPAVVRRLEYASFVDALRTVQNDTAAAAARFDSALTAARTAQAAAEQTTLVARIYLLLAPGPSSMARRDVPEQGLESVRLPRYPRAVSSVFYLDFRGCAMHAVPLSSIYALHAGCDGMRTDAAGDALAANSTHVCLERARPGQSVWMLHDVAIT